MLSQTEENYLKAVYSLSVHSKKSASTNAIAKKLNTKASSVTDMIKKLSEKEFVNYEKYKGTTLTKTGLDISVEIIRKHRLWEVFLVNHLNYNWDEVHDLAEQLEHINSDSLIDRLDRFLKYPKFDPHGDPIPDKYGNIEQQKKVMLASISKGEKCTVIGVKDSSPFLKYLDALNIKLGSVLTINDIIEFDKSMLIENEGISTVISNQIAQNLFVTNL
jgi:DtxR family Mn-dependent transcriptional regulator